MTWRCGCPTGGRRRGRTTRITVRGSAIRPAFGCCPGWRPRGGGGASERFSPSASGALRRSETIQRAKTEGAEHNRPNCNSRRRRRRRGQVPFRRGQVPAQDPRTDAGQSGRFPELPGRRARRGAPKGPRPADAAGDARDRRSCGRLAGGGARLRCGALPPVAPPAWARANQSPPYPGDAKRLRENCVAKDDKEQASLLFRLVVDANSSAGVSGANQMTRNRFYSRFVREGLTVPLLTWKVWPSSYERLLRNPPRD